MKRSRTCQCLQELDGLPKRSRSTPDLGTLSRASEVFGRDNFSPSNVRNFGAGGFDTSLSFAGAAGAASADGTLRAFRHIVRASGAGMTQQRTTATMGMVLGGVGGAEDFVVDSIVRSKGSLNEITILEHEQFIGDESVDLSSGGGGGGGTAAALFGGPVSGPFFDDSGDSSDYFCGIDSDEADEDSATIGPGGDGAGGTMVGNTGRSMAPPGGIMADSDGVAAGDAARQGVEAGAVFCSDGNTTTNSDDDNHDSTTAWDAPSCPDQEKTTMPMWCQQPRGYGGLTPPHRLVPGAAGRGVVGWRSVCSAASNGNGSGNGISGRPRTSLLPVVARERRATVSPPWPTGVPGVWKDAPPAAAPPPPPSHSPLVMNDVGVRPATSTASMQSVTTSEEGCSSTASEGCCGVAASEECGGGSEQSCVTSSDCLSASAPCPAAVGMYGGGEAATPEMRSSSDSGMGANIVTNTSGYRTQDGEGRVTVSSCSSPSLSSAGHDVAALLKLERLHLDPSPNPLLSSARLVTRMATPDKMWQCRASVPLAGAVAAEASMH